MKTLTINICIDEQTGVVTSKQSVDKDFTIRDMRLVTSEIQLILTNLIIGLNAQIDQKLVNKSDPRN
jgi:hypothetical protein